MPQAWGYSSGSGFGDFIETLRASGAFEARGEARGLGYGWALLLRTPWLRGV